MSHQKKKPCRTKTIVTNVIPGEWRPQTPNSDRISPVSGGVGAICPRCRPRKNGTGKATPAVSPFSGAAASASSVLCARPPFLSLFRWRFGPASTSSAPAFRDLYGSTRREALFLAGASDRACFNACVCLGPACRACECDFSRQSFGATTSNQLT